MSPLARPLLLPLNPVYRLALALRGLQLRSGLEAVRRLRWPVVSVGSLSAGGAGKTPMTIALAKALSEQGYRVDVLSRGYGRSGRDAAQVEADGSAEDFGDEPLLVAQAAGVPVFVAARRFDAGEMAESAGGDDGARQVHLLDDGFQHRQLHRDVDILLVSRSDWHDRLLPAGNRREALRAAGRASVIAIPADEPDFLDELKAWGWSRPIWWLRREMKVPDVDGAVVAFCGIARPEPFFDGLERAGLRLAAKMVFRDHHRFSAREIEAIVSQARGAGAVALITTEKDRVRLGDLAGSIPPSLPLLTAGLRIELEDEAVQWLLERLAEVSPLRGRAPS